jgi:hypothetical protein
MTELKKPAVVVIPAGCIRCFVEKVVSAIHSYPAWVRMVDSCPHALHAGGNFLELRQLPYSLAELGMSTVRALVVKTQDTASPDQAASDQEEDGEDFSATPFSVGETALDREIKRKNNAISFFPVEKMGGRVLRQLYVGNKPVKEKELEGRYELDVWLTKALVNYPDLLEGVARGDVWSIWSNMVERGRPRDEDIRAKKHLFLLNYIYPTEIAAQFIKRMDAEVLLLRGWGQPLTQAVVEKAKVDGLRYIIEVQAGHNLSDYTLVQSQYHKVMWDLDKVRSNLTLSDYMEEIARYEEETGMHKARSGQGKRTKPTLSLKAEGARQRFCFDFQLGKCTRDECKFLHEKNEGAREWSATLRAGTTGGDVSSRQFELCKAQGVCFNFNTRGCHRKACPFEHKKLSVSDKRRLCSKCKVWHKPGEPCVTSAHQTQAGERSSQEESEPDGGAGESGSESDDQPTATGSMATVLNNLTYAQSANLRKGLGEAKPKRSKQRIRRFFPKNV